MEEIKSWLSEEQFVVRKLKILEDVWKMMYDVTRTQSYW